MVDLLDSYSSAGNIDFQHQVFHKGQHTMLVNCHGSSFILGTRGLPRLTMVVEFAASRALGQFHSELSMLHERPKFSKKVTVFGGSSRNA